MVGVKGARGPVAACTTPVREGMVVDTKDATAHARREGRRRARALRLPRARSRVGAGDEETATSCARSPRHFGLDDEPLRRRAPRLREGRSPPVHQDGPRTSASSAGAACARATRSRARSRSRTRGAASGTQDRRRAWTRRSPTARASRAARACRRARPARSTRPRSARRRRSTGRSRRPARTAASAARSTCTCAATQVVAIDPGARRPVEPRPHVRQGPLRAPVRARARPAHVAADAPRPTARWREATLGRGDGLRRRRSSTEIKRQHGPDAIAFDQLEPLHERRELHPPEARSARRSARTTSTTARASATRRRRSASSSRSASRAGRTRSPTSTSRACLLLTGANPTEGHPVVGARMKEARAPRREAHRHRSAARSSSPRWPTSSSSSGPGTQRRASTTASRTSSSATASPTGVPRRARRGRRARTASFIAQLRPEARRGDHAACPRSSSRRAAHLYATTPPAAIFYGLGVTEQAQGVSGVRCLANLAILTGNLGKPRRRLESAARPEQRAGLERRRRAADVPHDVPHDGRRRDAHAVRGEVGRRRSRRSAGS